MKSTFTTSFHINAERVNKQGTTTVQCRITINGKVQNISTKINVAPDRWNAKESRTKGRTAEDRQINDSLENFRLALRNKYFELLHGGEAVSAELLKHSLFSTDNKVSMFLHAFDLFNEKQRQRMESGNLTDKQYTRYLLTRERLEEFILLKYRQRDIPIKQLTTAFLEDFAQYLLITYELHPNTIAKNMQRMRTLFLYCQKNQWTGFDPFSGYTISFKPSHRDSLTQHEINLLLTKKIRNKRIETIRDIFLFVVYTGVSYSDLKQLKTIDIYHGYDGKLWISNERIKTNVHFDVPLLDVPLAIIEKYKKFQSENGGLLLPVYTNQKMNESLKDMAAHYKIDKKIHMHLGRHTFATTIALENGVSIEALSRMLGHTSIRTTQIYAKVSKVKLAHEMNRAKNIMDKNTATIVL